MYLLLVVNKMEQVHENCKCLFSVIIACPAMLLLLLLQDEMHATAVRELIDC